MRHSNPKIETITRELFISPKLSFLESLGVSSKEPLSESQMLSLHFLTQGEIDRFNAHRDSLLATDHAATLSKRLQTLNEVQEIIQSAKNEIEEREDLKKALKEAKKGVTEDVILTLLNPMMIIQNLTSGKSLKEIVLGQIRNAFMVSAGLPDSLVQAVDAISDLQSTVKNWVQNPSLFAAFLMNYGTDILDAGSLAALEAKVKDKPLLPEWFSKNAKTMLQKQDEAIKFEKDAIIERMLIHLERESRTGILPTNADELQKLSEYLQFINQYRGALQKAHRDGDDTAADRLAALDKRCQELIIWRRLLSPRDGMLMSVEGKLRASISSDAANAVRAVAESHDLDRELRSNPLINAAMNTHRILRKQPVHFDPMKEAEFLIALEDQRSRGEKAFREVTGKFKHIFSDKAGLGEAYLSTMSVLRERKKECVASMKARVILQLEDEFKADDHKRFLALSAIKQLEKMKENPANDTAKLTNDRVHHAIEQIKNTYQKNIGELLNVLNTDVVLFANKSNAELLALFKDATLDKKQKKLCVDEMLGRLLKKAVSEDNASQFIQSIKNYIKERIFNPVTERSEKKQYHNDLRIAERLYDKSHCLVREINPGLVHETLNVEADQMNPLVRMLNGLHESISAKEKVLLMCSKALLNSQLNQAFLDKHKRFLFSVEEGKEETAQQKRVREHYEKTKDVTVLIKETGDIIFGVEDLDQIKKFAEVTSERHELAKKLDFSDQSGLRGQYFVHWTPRTLEKLIADLKEFDAAVDSILPGDIKDALLMDIRHTREEIATTMLERLKLAYRNEPADLVAFYYNQHATEKDKIELSKVYALSDSQMITYVNFIKEYGDQALRDRLSQEVGEEYQMMDARRTSFMNAFNDYLKLARNHSASDADIAAAAATVSSTVDWLPKRAKEDTDVTYAKKMKEALQPSTLAQKDGPWRTNVESQKQRLSKERERIAKEIKPKAELAKKKVLEKKTALDDYRNANPFLKFLRLIFSPQGEAKRAALCESAKVESIEAEKLLARAELNYQIAEEKLTSHIDGVLLHVVSEARNEVVDCIRDASDEAEVKKRIASVYSLVNEHDASLKNRLDRELNFSTGFLLSLQEGVSISELYEDVTCVAVTEPHKAAAIKRVFSLVSGQSQYADENVLDALKKDVVDIERQDNAASSDELIEDCFRKVKSHYLDPIVNSILSCKKSVGKESEKSEQLGRLLRFYSRDEMQDKMRLLDRNVISGKFTDVLKSSYKNKQALKLPEMIAAYEKIKAEADKASDDLEARRADYEKQYELYRSALNFSDRIAFQKTEDEIIKEFPEGHPLRKAVDALTVASENFERAYGQQDKLEYERDDVQEKLNSYQSVMNAGMALVSVFKDCEGYVVFREKCFSFYEDRMTAMTSDIENYSVDDFKLDNQIFEWAEKARLTDTEEMSVQSTFNAIVSKKILQSPPLLWNETFACLVAKYGNADNKAAYRLIRMKEMIQESDHVISRSSEEVVFAKFALTTTGDPELVNRFSLLAQEKGSEEALDEFDSQISDAKEKLHAESSALQKVFLESLVTDGNPTWMHFVMMSGVENGPWLHDMTKNWILSSLVIDENSNNKVNKIVEDLLEGDVASVEDLEVLVGKENVALVLDAFLKLISVDKKAEFKPMEIGPINDISTLDIRKIEEIRSLGGKLVEMLFSAFKVPGKIEIDEYIVKLKAQKDLTVFAKEYFHNAITENYFSDAASKEESEKRSTDVRIAFIKDYLLMTPQERADLKLRMKSGETERSARAAIREEGHQKAAAEKDGFAFIEEIEMREKGKSEKYAYHYQKDPLTFYQAYLAQVQDLADSLGIKLFLARKFVEEFVTADTLESELQVFESQMVKPLSLFSDVTEGDRYVDPLLALLPKEQKLTFLPEGITDVASLKKNLLSIGLDTANRLDAFGLCKTWVEMNKTHPEIAPIFHYVLCCEKALHLRETMQAAHACIKIEKVMYELSEGEKQMADVVVLLRDNGHHLKNNFLASRIQLLTDKNGLNLMESLISQLESDVRQGDLNVKKMESICGIAHTFEKNEARIARINAVEKVFQIFASIHDAPQDIERDLDAISKLRENEKALFVEALTSKIKNMGAKETFSSDIAVYIKIASVLNDKKVNAHISSAITAYVLASLAECAKGEQWNSRGYRDLFAIPGVLDRINSNEIAAELLKISKDESVSRELKDIVLLSSVQLIERKVMQLLGSDGAEQFEKCKKEKVEDYKVSGTRGLGARLRRERGEPDALKIMNDTLQSHLALLKQYASPTLKEAFFKKAVVFLNTPQLDSFRKKQAEAVRAVLTPAQNSAINLKRFFDSDGRLNHKEVASYSAEFAKATHEYRRLSEQDRALLGLNGMVEAAKKEAHSRLSEALGAFHASSDFFGSDADSPDDRLRRKENESIIPAAYALVAALGESEPYANQLEEVIYPNYLRYVVYREGDHASGEQTRYFRYGLFEALHKVSGIPDPSSLKMLSEHRKDPPPHSLGRQQFFASHTDLGKQFILHCQDEWRKMTLDALLKLENVGIVFQEERVVRAKAAAEKIIAEWNSSHPDLPVSIEQKNQIERECYLKQMVAEKNPADEKQIAFEKAALCVREDLVGNVLDGLRSSCDGIFRYSAVQRAIVRDESGNIVRLTSLDDKDLKNKIDGSWGGMRDNPNIFKYEEIHDLFFLLKKVSERFAKNPGSHFEIDLAFVALKEALNAVIEKIKSHKEVGGEFDVLTHAAHRKVMAVEKQWQEMLVGDVKHEVATVSVADAREFKA